MLHLPLLRHGRAYRSLDVDTTVHYRTRDPFVAVSRANVGLIRRDLLAQAEAREPLAALPASTLMDISRRAAEELLHGTLPLDPESGERQTPDDYVRQVSATTGLPHVMVRRNLLKVAGVLAEIEEVIEGLTRGLPLTLLDAGVADAAGHTVSFYPRAQSLGVVLPSNSPGVHGLWAPSIALKMPLVLKPGSAEPWTPYRVAQAFFAAGCPPSAFCYYPTDHAGAEEILRRSGRGMVFGDTAAIAKWAAVPRIERHGPGYSKVILGADIVDRWEDYLDVIVASIVDNGGRSCVNASGVWVPRHADAIADALADRLARISPLAEDDEAAAIAPFVDPGVARRISALVDQGLAEPGADDITAAKRSGERLVTWNGCTYLLPTVLRASPDHPLANREFLFPYASVVEVDEAALPEALGPSLVVTAITADRTLIDRLVSSPLVDRLNVGPIPTTRIAWDQPHEGNLFEHLYGRRAIQRSA
jgi:acyl-CoA reductase-like NAD-dependent aldehyde dehydrogenase